MFVEKLINVYLKNLKKTYISTGYLALINSNLRKNFLTFLDNEKYIKECNKNRYAKYVIVSKRLKDKLLNSKKIIIYKDPKYLFFKLLNIINSKISVTKKNKIHKSAKIHKTCILNGNQIYIGKNVVVEANVIINEKSKIMDNSIIRSGCVIGGDQLELKNDQNKNLFNVRHRGSTLISSNVEVGYGTIIDRALYDYDSTKIGRFTKIGYNNLISHNTKIGKNNMIMSNVVIGGTCKIGNHNWIGASSTLSNQLYIGNHNHITMGSVLFENMKNHQSVVKDRIIKKKIFKI